MKSLTRDLLLGAGIGLILLGLALTLSSFVRSSSGWEYRVGADVAETRNNRQLAARLDSLGADGWELVAVSDGLAYFKRPLGR